MAEWKRWDSYDEVPVHILGYPYIRKELVEAESEEYLSHLNRVFNPMPARQKAQTKKGVPCVICSKRLTPDEAEGRLCEMCVEKLAEKGSVLLSHGWKVAVKRA